MSPTRQRKTAKVGKAIGVKEKHKVDSRGRGAFWNLFEVYSDNEMIYRS